MGSLRRAFLSIIFQYELMPLNFLVQRLLGDTERLACGGNTSILLTELVLDEAALELADLV